ncbi:MAG: decaprenyl-phosphate phosphoribosyltransferase [Anaerolineae bacterium]|jgi:4-hydroxybenzoate polyprenyltransferase|nr:decaprenyl-phosphate phosphoribosyltransferase [Anaerolineae bacterium]
MQILRALFKTMRPKQWTKNGIIFAALVFDKKIFQWDYLWRTVLGFLLFSLISGVVYIINDIVDMEKDRQHPRKRQRPLASGALSPRLALGFAIVVGLASLAIAFWLSTGFGLILAGYLVLQIAYSLYLKNIVLLDIIAIAAGFVLRVAAGTPLVDAENFSPWLYICTTLLALFLALGKRRGELMLLGEEAGNHRESLQFYTCGLLDQLISLVTSSTLLAYALYTFSAPNLPQNHAMMLTVPFVIYGLFRYLYLVHAEGVTLAPDEVLLTDRPLQVDLLLWGVSAASILYLG